MSRRKLVENVKKMLKEDIIVFHANGKTSLLVFTSHANTALRVRSNISAEEEDMSDEEFLQPIAKKIQKEGKEITKSRKKYLNRISLPLAKDEASPTLAKLLNLIILTVSVNVAIYMSSLFWFLFLFNYMSICLLFIRRNIVNF